MDMQPQPPFKAAPEFALNLPFAELPKEDQIDLLGQQVMQLKQLAAMQQMLLI